MKRVILIFSIFLLLVQPVRASDQPKYLALTFDDGPSGVFTQRLLDGLAERQVHATFFLCGYRIRQYPDTARRIADEGHELGIHGDTHTFFTQLSPGGVCEDLAAARQSLEETTGKSATLLRPPGGLYDAEVLRQTVCADLPVILWSIDPEDWRRSDTGGIARQIIRQAESGDIILMHDLSNSSIDAALRVIDALEAQGFEFVTVSELALLSDTGMEPGRVYHQFVFPNRDGTDCAAQADPRNLLSGRFKILEKA